MSLALCVELRFGTERLLRLAQMSSFSGGLFVNRYPGFLSIASRGVGRSGAAISGRSPNMHALSTCCRESFSRPSELHLPRPLVPRRSGSSGRAYVSIPRAVGGSGEAATSTPCPHSSAVVDPVDELGYVTPTGSFLQLGCNFSTDSGDGSFDLAANPPQKPRMRNGRPSTQFLSFPQMRPPSPHCGRLILLLFTRITYSSPCLAKRKAPAEPSRPGATSSSDRKYLQKSLASHEIPAIYLFAHPARVGFEAPHRCYGGGARFRWTSIRS